MFTLLFVCALQSIEVEPVEIPEGLSNADACSICKTVVGGIAGFIGASPVQSIIKQLALGLCNKFSGSGNTLCKNIVNKLPTILSYLSKGLSKANVCSRINVCKSNDEEMQYEIPEGIANRASDSCGICKEALAEYESLMKFTLETAYVLDLGLLKDVYTQICNQYNDLKSQLACKTIFQTYIFSINANIKKGRNVVFQCIFDYKIC
ncbi:Saposin-like type B, region 1 family protein [Histomonas meleagridis]|uniref:Saposin-like type B, region 1 family protein n=1 Tax=Histomonas meleagridis TaxID=135588 RepID=UPI0035593B46|nr:Saposin-like type B, region 1 family protein [Histomonas meleagridis]KAH0804173.1 Saposin-like type B, region 1 family protein [Histomonas meleagridis]